MTRAPKRGWLDTGAVKVGNDTPPAGTISLFMSMVDPHRLDSEAWLAHREFARRFALALVGDLDRAEDLAQDALLAAVHRPPRNRAAMRGWLSRVVRNLAWRGVRDERRRRRRERDAAPPRSSRQAADSVAEIDAHRRVVAVLLALEEPFRSTLVQRFYDDLKPREIARREGVPAATVRTRIHRGLEKLRKALDERHGGDRRAWTVALLPLAHLAASKAVAGGLGAILLGGFAMQLKTKVAVVCTAALLLSALLVVWNLSADGDRQSPRATPIEAKTPARTPGPELSSAPELATDIERQELRVRVVDRLGAPIPAARVGLRPIGRFITFVRGAAGVSPDWLDADWHAAFARPAFLFAGRTDDSGRVSFEVPRFRPWFVEASCEGYAPTLRRHDSGVHTSEAVLTLRPGHALSGRVLDARGRPVSGAAVHAVLAQIAFIPGWAVATQRCITDGEGRYGFALASGDWALWVEPPGGPPMFIATTRIPDLRQIDLWLPPLGTLRGVVTDRVSGAPLEGVEVRAQTSGQPPAVGRAVTDAEGRYRIEALPAGSLARVEAESKDHAVPVAESLPLSPVVLRAGAETVLDLALVRAGALRATVKGPDGPVAGALVQAIAIAGRRTITRQARTGPDGRAELRGLRPGRHLVRALHTHLYDPNRPSFRQALWEKSGRALLTLFEAGAVVERSFTLRAPDGRIEGQVLDADGAAVPGVQVKAARAEGITDGHGVFVLRGCQASPHVHFQLEHPSYIALSTGGGLALEPGASLQGVVLRMRPRRDRAIQGRIRAPGALREPYVEFRYHQATEGIRFMGYGWLRNEAGEDGAFRIEVKDRTPAVLSVDVRAGALGFGMSERMSIPVAETEVPGEVVLNLRDPLPLTGLVVDEQGAAVRGAQVAIVEKSVERLLAVSDKLGRFDIKLSESRKVNLRVKASGALPVTKVVSPRDTAPIVFTLLRERVITGSVRARTGLPVVGFRVTASRRRKPGEADGPSWLDVRTDERGVFRFEGLAPGLYRIEASAGRGGPNFVQRTLEEVSAGTTGLEIVVDPGLAIRGRVIDAQGDPVARASVSASRKGEGPLQPSSYRGNAVTGADGSFEVVGIPAGLYYVRATGRGRRKAALQDIPAGSVEVVVLRLQEPLSITGRILDESGRPIAGVRFDLVRAGKRYGTVQRVQRGLVTNSLGAFTSTGLPVGESFSLRIVDARYKAFALEGPEKIPAGTKDAVWKLVLGRALRGVVRDEDGRPVADATVTARAERGDVRLTSRAGADGRFEVVGLPRTGKVWLTVGAKGYGRRVVEGGPGGGDLAVVLPPGLSAAGRLLDRNGEPLAGWRVEVLAPESDDRVAQTVTDKEGRFRVEGISAEEHRVRVHWRGVGKWRVADVGRLRGGDMAIELRTRFTD